MKFLRSLYIKNRLIGVLGGLATVYLLGYGIPVLFTIANIILLGIFVATLLDLFVLYHPKNLLKGHRECAERLSNGDENTISIYLFNLANVPLSVKVLDDIPDQFQARDVSFETKVPSRQDTVLTYGIKPTKRGAYNFGDTHVIAGSPIGLFARKVILEGECEVAVYPSIIQLKKYEFLAISKNLEMAGIKKIRKINHGTDFEQVRDYIQGDNYRNINWKSTARGQKLMVNQYQDEKSQDVYCIINMGRTMKMPFQQLSLLDYAINSTLVMLNTALIKGDRAGLLTFNNQVRSTLRASKKNDQLNKIMRSLYNAETAFEEADYYNLYAHTKKTIRKRSLIFLYMNIEAMESLNHSLSQLKLLARSHVLVVVFFRNTELNDLGKRQSKDLKGVYTETIARKLEYDKEQVVLELRKHGIYSVLTKPENLTVDSVNKYLELKARGIF